MSRHKRRNYSTSSEDDSSGSDIRIAPRRKEKRSTKRLSDCSDESDDSDDSSSDSSGSSSSTDSEHDVRFHRARRRRRKPERSMFLANLSAGAAVLILLVGVYLLLSLETGGTDTGKGEAGNAESTRSGAVAGSTSRTSSRSGNSTTSATSKTTASAVPISPIVGASKDTAWMPVKKIRGVNLGSLFVFEPWMAGDSWKEIGCQGFDSEWGCIEKLGRDKVQAGFENHWSTWYTEKDFTDMEKIGLNTVRIPLGYWTVDSLIGDDFFPRGSWSYVKQVVKWAKAAGLYVILDLHGAPGSQTVDQSFTGHSVKTAGFFNDAQYERAISCLTNWTTEIHTNDDFSTVTMIQVVNEPLQDTSITGSMLDTFYPNALKAIRKAEADLGITCEDDSYRCLGVQFMDTAWGSGDPTKHIDVSDHVVFDDHGYAQWIAKEQTRKSYLQYLCTTTRSTDMSPIIVGEWSLSAIDSSLADFALDGDGADEFYSQFAAAQLLSAEKGAGWVFWSWKTELGDPRWSYQEAQAKGWFPSDLDTIDKKVCDGIK